MDLGNMMQNVRNMTERMKSMQDAMRDKVVEGTAGGGMVTARMNGAGELIGIEIDKSVIDPDDAEMLSDLVVAAVNAARKKVEELRAESVREMTGGIDLGAMGIDLDNLT